MFRIDRRRLDHAADVARCTQAHLVVDVIEQWQQVFQRLSGARIFAAERIDCGGSNPRIFMSHEGQADIDSSSSILSENLDTHLPHPIVAVQQQAPGKLGGCADDFLHRSHRLLVIDGEILFPHSPDENLRVASLEHEPREDHGGANDNERRGKMPQAQKALGVKCREPADQHESPFHDHPGTITVALWHEFDEDLVCWRDDTVQEHVVEDVEDENG